MHEFVHIDLFSGIGGFALGFQKAGLNVKEHFFSEIDKNAINIYKNRFPKAKELGDVTTIRDFSDLRRACAGKIVIITFGFPCQDLSVAGKGAGLAGARSGLFFEAIRIVKELNPQYFIFENVKGLLTNNRGADFVRCLREIADIGLYDCEWQLVNTSWFLPQNRERVYFVGHLRGKSTPKIFPIERKDIETIKIDMDISSMGEPVEDNPAWEKEEQEIIEEIKNFNKVRQINRTGKNHQQDRVYDPDGIAPCLNTVGGGNLEPKIVLPSLGLYHKVSPRFMRKPLTEMGRCLKSNSSDCAVAVPVLTPERANKRQNGRRFKNNGDVSFTLTTQDRHGISDGISIRKLTPLECERLQGFPDGWTEYGADGKKISDSARYKALGNAVSVPLPEIIGKRLLEGEPLCQAG